MLQPKTKTQIKKDLSQKTMVELKAKLQRAKLSVSGSKEELIERLAKDKVQKAKQLEKKVVVKTLRRAQGLLLGGRFQITSKHVWY